MSGAHLLRAVAPGPCDPAPRGQMADGDGGDGGRGARFAALASQAQLPPALTADAGALLAALQPCVAAYDASEEGRQPLVSAPAARAAPREQTHWQLP